jgi:hypothetical protein
MLILIWEIHWFNEENSFIQKKKIKENFFLEIIIFFYL